MNYKHLRARRIESNEMSFFIGKHGDDDDNEKDLGFFVRIAQLPVVISAFVKFYFILSYWNLLPFGIILIENVLCIVNTVTSMVVIASIKNIYSLRFILRYASSNNALEQIKDSTKIR